VRRCFRAAVLFSVLLPPLAAASAAGQEATREETVVIAVGRDPGSPVPTLLLGNVTAREVSELLFLPLASLGPNTITIGDKDFLPGLARSWKRRDSLTLVFEIDPRARWHDGIPVTARDAALALNLARDPSVDPSRALLLRRLTSATAEDPQHLVVRFSEAYDEQFYDVIYHVSPLPAHLIDTVPRGALGRSAYAGAPVGNGPYRWVRRVPGQQIDLAANESFFRGTPGPRRVTFLIASDPEAQINLLLSGGADVLQALGPVSNVARVAADKRFTIYPVLTLTVGYLLFNQRDPADLARPHPILADREVRAAIALALDVPAMVQATFGQWATVPFGPVPRLSWIRDPAARPAMANRAGARALLRARGWVDSDGDGVLDRNGQPLALSLNYPAQSAPRGQLALLVQEQLRQVGIRIEINRLDGSVWQERRQQGNFDMDLSSATMDPSPSGLVQSWSCAGRGGSNVAYYCDPRVDSLLASAQRDRKHSLALFRQAVRTIVDDAPAVFLYSPTNPYSVSSRIRGIELNPIAPFSALWRWNPGPFR
jgi:peptide/nickel transport system substrate-binding protein